MASPLGGSAPPNDSAETLLFKDPVAPLADPGTFQHHKVTQIDSGPVDYVIKCTEGLFKGRFIYVNRTPQGELFGSDKNSKEITMYIENARLSPKHAEIKFNEQTFQYYLRDAKSEDGTWVGIRWNRSVEIGPEQMLQFGVELRVAQGAEIEDEVASWLQIYFATPTAEELAESLAQLDVRSFAELKAFNLDTLDTSAENRRTLRTAVSEMDTMFPAGFPRYKLVIMRGEEQVCELAWGGGTIMLAPENWVPKDSPTVPRLAKEVVRGTVHLKGAASPVEELRIGYSFGRYYVHLSESSADTAQKSWVRLRENQTHWLQPQDVFRIGTLEFAVLRFNAACYGEQGFRATMEDEECFIQDLAVSNWRHVSFFGVYDGHGGQDCATFLRKKLHMNFIGQLHSRGGLDRSGNVHKDVYEALRDSYFQTDTEFLNLAQTKGYPSGAGCAAVVVLLVGGYIWCANCGDSRAVLCRGGQAIQLSVDHKPDRPDETRRIEQAGGFVSFKRVLGRLAVSRAFGDQEYKVMSEGQQLVIVDPEIRIDKVKAADEFLLIACDGLFDVFSSQEAVDFLRKKLAAMPPNEQDPEKAVRDLVRDAIVERHSRDNVTAILVTFKRCVVDT